MPRPRTQSGKPRVRSQNKRVRVVSIRRLWRMYKRLAIRAGMSDPLDLIRQHGAFQGCS
jgi:hypothetical protein